MHTVKSMAPRKSTPSKAPTATKCAPAPRRLRAASRLSSCSCGGASVNIADREAIFRAMAQPAPKAKTTVAVKLTDMLGEEVVVEA